jgi:hypothetical protein
MNEIDKKVIKFLLSAAVYSDNAIMKNLGISEEELKNSYITLEREGYLESYSDYQARQSNSCGSGSCEGRNCSSCGSCCSNDMDYSNVKVITEKAIFEFDK